jgi:hypothetical protein
VIRSIHGIKKANMMNVFLGCLTTVKDYKEKHLNKNTQLMEVDFLEKNNNFTVKMFVSFHISIAYVT